MADHFGALGFILPPDVDPLVLAAQAVQRGERHVGGVPGTTVVTHAWDAGAGMGIWAVSHEERRDLLTAYPVFRAHRRREFFVDEAEYDGADAVARGRIGQLPIAFHVYNYCRDNIWELPQPVACQAHIAGIAYAARLLPAAIATHLRPAAKPPYRFLQEECDYDFAGSISSIVPLRNPASRMPLWHCVLTGQDPVPWELEVVLPQHYLPRRPSPGQMLAGVAWLQGALERPR